MQVSWAPTSLLARRCLFYQTQTQVGAKSVLVTESCADALWRCEGNLQRASTTQVRLQQIEASLQGF